MTPYAGIFPIIPTTFTDTGDLGSANCPYLGEADAGPVVDATDDPGVDASIA